MGSVNSMHSMNSINSVHSMDSRTSVGGWVPGSARKSVSASSTVPEQCSIFIFGPPGMPNWKGHFPTWKGYLSKLERAIPNWKGHFPNWKG